MSAIGWSDGYAGAEGTWTITGEKSGAPIQTSRIQCVLERKECTEARAVIYGDTMSVDLSSYKIKKWDDSTVVYVDDQSACTEYTYTIDRATNSVNGMRKKKSGVNVDSCGMIEKDLRLSLDSGRDIAIGIRKENQPNFFALASIVTAILIGVALVGTERKNL